MKFAIFFALLASVASLQYSCYVRTYFAKLCYQFAFEGSCQPWQLEECKPIRVTTMDYHCPRYFCDPVEDTTWPPTPTPSNPSHGPTHSPAPGSPTTGGTPATSQRLTSALKETSEGAGTRQADLPQKNPEKALARKETVSQHAEPSVKMNLNPTKDASEKSLNKRAGLFKSSTDSKTPLMTSSKDLKAATRRKTSTKLASMPSATEQASSMMKPSRQLSMSNSEEPGLRSSSLQPALEGVSEDSEDDLVSFETPTARSSLLDKPNLPPFSQTEKTRTDSPSIIVADSAVGAQVEVLPESPLLSNASKSIQTVQNLAELKPSPEPNVLGFKSSLISIEKLLTKELEQSTKQNLTQEKSPDEPNVQESSPIFIEKMSSEHFEKSTELPIKITDEPDALLTEHSNTPMNSTEPFQKSEVAALIQEVSKKKSFEEHLEEFLRMPRIRAATTAEKDCGTKICVEELHFESVCVVYVDESDSVVCDFPCSKANCSEEIHYGSDCPTWLCFDKTTTTQAPRTTSPVGPTPTPSDGSNCFKSSACIASVTFNGLIILVGLICLSVFLKIRYFTARASTGTSMANPLFDDFVNYNPIIRSSSERLPLLPLRSTESQRSLPSPNPGLSQTSRVSTASTSSIALNPSAPDLTYVESNF